MKGCYSSFEVMRWAWPEVAGPNALLQPVHDVVVLVEDLRYKPFFFQPKVAWTMGIGAELHCGLGDTDWIKPQRAYFTIWHGDNRQIWEYVNSVCG